MNSLAERAAKTDTVAQWRRISKLADNPNLTNADYGDCDLDRLTRRIGRTKPEANMTNAIRLILIAGTIAAMGCASPRLAQNNDMAPVRVDADENGAAVMMDVTQGGLINWVKSNPWKVAGTVAAGYAAYRVGDHNDWFQGNSKGDRKATQTYVEINGDNNRVVIVSDYATASASGDSNTGSGGQKNGADN